MLLKTAGLCALMAMHGLHIPASPDSRIGIFFKILTDIGDDQSLEKSLATFSEQIVELNTMIEQADNETLICSMRLWRARIPATAQLLRNPALSALSRQARW